MNIRNNSIQNDLKKRSKAIKLSEFNSTRWSSLFISLEKLFKEKNSVIDYFNELAEEYNESNKKYIENLSRGKRAIFPKKSDFLTIMERIPDISWGYLSSLLKVLKLCNEYNKELQSEQMTLSMAHLGLKILINESLITEEKEYSIIKVFINDLRESFINQFMDTMKSEEVLVCCLIDSRTKYFIENHLVGLTEEEYNISKEKLRNMLFELEIQDNRCEKVIEIGGKYDIYKVYKSDSIETQINHELKRWLVSKDNVSTG